MITQIPDLLTRYIMALGSSECQFWGVDTSASTIGPPVDVQCTKWFTRNGRLTLGQYLQEAVTMLENALNFGLYTRWITDEQHPYQHSYHTRWNNIVAGGIRGVTTIAINSVVDHTGDPAIIGPIATTVTDESEIHIYFNGLNEEIIPEDVTISGGNVTITVPRCRMVLPSKQINTEDWGVDYTDLANFEDGVDIKRIYNDTSTQVEMVKCHNCSEIPCQEETATGCLLVKNPLTGFVKVTPATYSSGTWTRSGSNCGCGYRHIRLNYQIAAPEVYADRVILQLAHALMPESPCGCQYVRNYWANARNNPDMVDEVRMTNPFGQNDGCYSAYRWAVANKIRRMGLF